MRRVVHLVLIAGVIAGVRACGGLPAVGDRLAATTRWVGDRTGIKGLQQAWRSDVVPAVKGATKSASRRSQQAVSDALERAGSDATEVRSNIRSAAAAAAATIEQAPAKLLGDSGAAGSTSPASGSESSTNSQRPNPD
jgi:hypothetical protein